MKVMTKRLGLAAYIKLQDPESFREKQDGHYIFDSEKSGREWRLSYIKSQFSQYNSEMINLRQL